MKIIIRIQLKAVLVVDHHFLHSLYTFDVDVIHIPNQSLNLKNGNISFILKCSLFSFLTIHLDRILILVSAITGPLTHLTIR